MNDRGVEFEKWAKAVKVRDDFTCQICDVRGVYLEAHHIWSWNEFPELRFDLDTGRSLCLRCHTRFHDQFGYGNNTEFQYKQYEEIAKTLRKLASSEKPPDFLSHAPKSREDKE
jgi:5-methylcytosine-specific restriction endonuclease McrA